MFLELPAQVGFPKIGNCAELFEADGFGMVFFQILPDGFHAGVEVFPDLFGKGRRGAAEFDEEQAEEGIGGGFVARALLLLLAVE